MLARNLIIMETQNKRDSNPFNLSYSYNISHIVEGIKNFLTSINSYYL